MPADRRAKKLKALSDKAFAVISHPVTAFVAALVLSAIAASGRISMGLANLLLLVAFLVVCFGITRTRLRWSFVILLWVVLACVFAPVVWWVNSPAPNPSAAPTEPTQTTKIVEVPSVGNLKERAIELSHEIMEDLYVHGWPMMRHEHRMVFKDLPHLTEMPPIEDMKRSTIWHESRSGYFRFRFLARVRDLRDEFSQLHLRDRRLDDFFKTDAMITEANNRLRAAGQRDLPSERVLLPQEIEEIAECLIRLASQLPGGTTMDVHLFLPRPICSSSQLSCIHCHPTHSGLSTST